MSEGPSNEFVFDRVEPRLYWDGVILNRVWTISIRRDERFRPIVEWLDAMQIDYTLAAAHWLPVLDRQPRHARPVAVFGIPEKDALIFKLWWC